MTLLCFFVLVLSLQIEWSNAACPPAEVVSPCTCNFAEDGVRYGDQIICEGNDNINLKNIFKRISDNRTENERHFYKLIIYNKLNEEIESNVIGNLTFDFIATYELKKLQRIHWLAFENSAKRVKYFHIRYSPEYSIFPAPYNLFDMLQTFVNVEWILIDSVNITHLPREGFKPLPSLNTLIYRNEKLINSLTVADRAFYNLDNLTRLSLSEQRIDYFPQNAFKFRHDSNRTLQLQLDKNKLNSLSFSSRWLNNINRPVNVDLSSNEITFLDQSVFQLFLDETRNNRIDLGNNPLTCTDCKNAWLKKEREKYRSRVDRAYCDGRYENPTIIESNFDHCPVGVCSQSPEVFSPCTCEYLNDKPMIICGGFSPIDLKNVFQRISSQIKVPDQKNFGKLLINNRALSEIEAEVTKDVTFEEIEISAENLLKIHSGAFSGTTQKVKKFIVTEETSSLRNGEKPYNLFELINSFINAEEVDFLAPNVDQIPSQAFKKLTKLRTLYFGRVILQSPKRLSIANDSFLNNNNLTQISLKLNRINNIDKNAFHFQELSSNRLALSLASNDLNQSSFAFGTLTALKRPTSIDLNYNHIHYLEGNIFQPFLDLNFGNQIVDLSNNPFNCSDCRNYWLVDDKEKYVRRVLKAFCDGKIKDEIFDRNMNHCKPKLNFN